MVFVIAEMRDAPLGIPNELQKLDLPSLVRLQEDVHFWELEGQHRFRHAGTDRHDGQVNPSAECGLWRPPALPDSAALRGYWRSSAAK